MGFFPPNIPKIPRPSQKISSMDKDQILITARTLAQIAKEFDLEKIKISSPGDIKIKIQRSRKTFPSPQTPDPPPSTPKQQTAPSFITSPFVGTFYRSPSPEAKAFVDINDYIQKGKTVCIIEAMKLMNEIESDLEGKIAEILVQNGEHVEYGQNLFRLVP